MDAIPLFMNDASYPLSAVADWEVEREILQLMKTLKRVKGLNRPIILGSALRLTEIPITRAYRTLASYAEILGREWWRFIRGLEQRAPYSSMPQCVGPDVGVHISHGGGGSVGVLWSIKNSAFMISFASSAPWRTHVVPVSVCSCTNGRHAPEDVTCRNISAPEHVELWQNDILDFSYSEASSSTIYDSVGFRLKMYLNDHEPPHVHVYQSGNLRKCIGRVRLDHVEVMEDEGFSGAVKKDVLELLSARRDELLRAWIRCRGGQLPNQIA